MLTASGAADGLYERHSGLPYGTRVGCAGMEIRAVDRPAAAPSFGTLQRLPRDRQLRHRDRIALVAVSDDGIEGLGGMAKTLDSSHCRSLA